MSSVGVQWAADGSIDDSDTGSVRVLDVQTQASTQATSHETLLLQAAVGMPLAEGGCL